MRRLAQEEAVRRSLAVVAVTVVLAAACTDGAGPSSIPGSTVAPSTRGVPSTTTPSTSIPPVTTTPVAPASVPLSTDAPAEPSHPAPLLVYRPVGGFAGISYVLMVWPDGRYREWGIAGLDIEDVAAIRALADVVPGGSGRVPTELVAALTEALGDVSRLGDVEDDTSCAQTDAVAHGYAFPDVAIAFTVCDKPEHEAIDAADRIVEQVGGLGTSDVVPASLSEGFESNVRSVVADGGHLVAGVVVGIVARDWAVDLDVVERLTGPEESAPFGPLRYALADRDPTPAELPALESLAVGDTMWALVNRTGTIVSLAAIDEQGALIDAGPAPGGLSLGNDGAVFAALGFGSRFGRLECELDPEFRPPPAGSYTAAGALLSVLHVWGVVGLRRTELGRSHPEWSELVVTLENPQPERWLAVANPRRSVVYGLDDIGAGADSDGQVTIAFPYPIYAALQLWELDRATLEPAGCDPQSVREVPELLDSHGTLLVAVPVDVVDGRALTIDLTTLTFRLGAE